MKLKITTKFTVLILTVLALAVASCSIAMVSTWQNEQLWLSVVNQQFASVRSAQELEITLLEQRGFVAAYILDGGDRQWLDEMNRRQPDFIRCLESVEKTAHTAEERQILAHLRGVFDEYDRRRDEAIALYDRGDQEAARRELLLNVESSYQRANKLCDDFLQANERYVDAAILQSHHQIDRMALISGSLVVVTCVISALLAWFLYRDIVRPLRSLVAEVQFFSGDELTVRPPAEVDELMVVGHHLRSLMSDVTDTRSTLQRSQKLLIDAEKLVSVGKLASSVAHEIRNPLTAIKMWLYSVRKSVSADPEVSRKLTLISDEIAHLESIVRNFLEFSRPPSLRCQPISLATQVDKALELLVPRFREKAIKVNRINAQPQLAIIGSAADDSAEIPGRDWPPVIGDGEQLKQVFVNLLLNAVDAANLGGEVTIETELTQANDRPWQVIRIRDSGCGIPAEVQARIFEPFFTTKEEGTGLGLCIAAQIMAYHGGRLLLESSSIQGTCFAIWIPCEGESS